MDPREWDRHIRRKVANTYRGALSEMKWEAVRKEGHVDVMRCDISFAFYVEFANGDRSVVNTKHYIGIAAPRGSDAVAVAHDRIRRELTEASLMGLRDRVVIVGAPVVTWASA